MTTKKCSSSPEPEKDEDLFCGNIGGQDAKVGYFLDISYTKDYIYFLNILVKKSLNIRLPSRDPTI